MKKGEYHLIIGMDDITNVKTIKKLYEIRQKTSNHLKVSAFLSSDYSSTFHPKFSWFRMEKGGIIVLGSGNLTQKGLRRNREAFVYEKVSNEVIDSIEQTWNEWLENVTPFLRKITDQEVKERAVRNQMENSKRERNSLEAVHRAAKRREKFPKEIEPFPPVDDQDEAGAWTFDSNSSVLIAEIPRSGNRWSQANFDVNTFEVFFGGKPGVNGIYRLVMRNVLLDGKLGEIKVVNTVSVASSNYRIELSNPDNIPYPSDSNGRPIGIFVRIEIRTFIYMLLLPGQKNYNKINNVVATKHKGRNLVRMQLSIKELEELAPGLPLLYYLV